MTAATERRADPDTVSDATGPVGGPNLIAAVLSADEGIANPPTDPVVRRYTPTRFYCPTCEVNGPADRAASHAHATIPAGTVADDFDPTPECTQCAGSGESAWGGICGTCAGNGVVIARGR